MNLQPLTAEDRELIETAQETAKRFGKEIFRDKHLSSTGSAMRTADGKVFSGPNIKHPFSASSGICAEYNAAAQVYSAGYREVETVATYYVGDRGFTPIAAPCGKCREFLRIFGDPYIIVEIDGTVGKVRLTELLPGAFI